MRRSVALEARSSFRHAYRVAVNPQRPRRIRVVSAAGSLESLQQPQQLKSLQAARQLLLEQHDSITTQQVRTSAAHAGLSHPHAWLTRRPSSQIAPLVFSLSELWAGSSQGLLEMSMLAEVMPSAQHLVRQALKSGLLPPLDCAHTAASLGKLR